MGEMVMELGTDLGGIAEFEATDAESFKFLYHKYHKLLFWACLRFTRNKEDAEDIVHQVFIKVQRNASSFRGQSGIYTWMYRIAVNECIQLFRKKKFEVASRVNPNLEQNDAFSFESGFHAKRYLESILSTSDPLTAEILSLLHVEGLKQNEVANALKISRSTINKKIALFRIKVGKSYGSIECAKPARLAPKVFDWAGRR